MMYNISPGHIHMTLKILFFVVVDYVAVTFTRKIFKFEIWPGENELTLSDKRKFSIK